MHAPQMKRVQGHGSFQPRLNRVARVVQFLIYSSFNSLAEDLDTKDGDFILHIYQEGEYGGTWEHLMRPRDL